MQNFHQDQSNALNFLYDTSFGNERVNTQYHEWNTYTTSSYDGGALTASANGVPGSSQGAGTNTALPNFQSGNFLERQHVVFQHQNSGFLGDAAGNAFSTRQPSDIPLMDVLWPDLASRPIGAAPWSAPLPSNAQYGHTQASGAISPAYVSSQSTGEEEDYGARKRRRRIPPQAKRLLEECFEYHRADPYIPQEEVERLVAQTGLTLRQVRTFFANARARKLPRASDSHALKGKSIAVSLPQNVQQDSPMERFLSSSPEEEGICEARVREAAETMNQKPGQGHRQRTGRVDALSPVSAHTPSSTSNSSAASVDSVHLRGARRGRKRQGDTTKANINSICRRPSSPSRKYQCTFCTLDFAQKYDWRRHEESVHFPQKEWVCMPDGPLHASHCVFCNQSNPEKRHLEKHKSITCSEAPRAQRAFLRKDKLIQHIKQVHSCQPPKGIKEWCRPIERNVMLVCGICSLVLPDWGTRVDHVASHFNDGISMDMWLLGRPGGVISSGLLHNHSVKRALATKFSAVVDPHGDITCEACPERFAHIANAILHRRQAHNTYYLEDKQTLSAIGAIALPESQDFSDIAQQTSHIRLNHLEAHASGLAPAAPRRPNSGGPVRIRRAPVMRSAEARQAKGLAMAIPSSIAHQTNIYAPESLPIEVNSSFYTTIAVPPWNGIPSQQGAPHNLATQQHADWRSSPYAHSRSPTPMISPVIDPALASDPNVLPPKQNMPAVSDDLVDPALRNDEYLQRDVNYRSINPATGMRSSVLSYDEVKTITQRVRSNRKGTGVAAQGMLHSFEQLREDAAPWPSPYDQPRT